MEGKIKDPNYPESDWEKMEHKKNHPDDTKTIIHYWEELKTGLRENFKFKDEHNNSRIYN